MTGLRGRTALIFWSQTRRADKRRCRCCLRPRRSKTPARVPACFAKKITLDAHGAEACAIAWGLVESCGACGGLKGVFGDGGAG